MGQICVFDKTGDSHPLHGTDYASNGYVVLQPKKAMITEKQNGDYYLELEVGREYEEFIEQDRILKVSTPFSGRISNHYYQLFRVKNIEHKPDRIIAKCPHVFYDLEGQAFANANNIEWRYDTKWYSALSFILSEGEGSFDSSNLQDYTRQSQGHDLPDFVETDIHALFNQSALDAINTLLNKNKGYLIRDNFKFGISAVMPSEPGNVNELIVEYGKNLTDISKKEEWSNLALHLYGIGNNEIRWAHNDLSPFYNYSDNYLYTRVVKFTQDIDAGDYSSESDYETALHDDLVAQMDAYLEEHKTPSISYTVKGYFNELNGRTRSVGMWYPVKVIDSRLGIDINTVVIGYKYDCILEKYSDVELSNVVNSMKGYNLEVKNRIRTSETDTLLRAYPIGSVYQGDSTNPSVRFGGYWSQISSSGGIYTWRRLA